MPTVNKPSPSKHPLNNKRAFQNTLAKWFGKEGFAYAENEDQMASVLAHELAHLSQRHFSRGAEAQKKTSVRSMAGLLASVVLAATAGGDAATAAMISSQALAMAEPGRHMRSLASVYAQ